MRRRLRALSDDGIAISDSIRNRLCTEGVLEIQCKAADRKVDSQQIIYFGYRDNAKSKTNTVPIIGLVHAFKRDPWRNGLLDRFLRMQEQIISNTAYR